MLKKETHTEPIQSTLHFVVSFLFRINVSFVIGQYNLTMDRIRKRVSLSKNSICIEFVCVVVECGKKLSHEGNNTCIVADQSQFQGVFTPSLSVSGDASVHTWEWVWDLFKASALMLMLMLCVNSTDVNQYEPSRRQRWRLVWIGP